MDKLRQKLEKLLGFYLALLDFPNVKFAQPFLSGDLGNQFTSSVRALKTVADKLEFNRSDAEVRFRQAIASLESITTPYFFDDRVSQCISDAAKELEFEITSLLAEIGDIDTLCFFVIAFYGSLGLKLEKDPGIAPSVNLLIISNQSKVASRLVKAILKSMGKSFPDWLNQKEANGNLRKDYAKIDLFRSFGIETFPVGYWYIYSLTESGMKLIKNKLIKPVISSDAAPTKSEIEMVFGNKYQAQQVGAMGHQAVAYDNIFNQTWNQIQNTVDLNSLIKELSALREQMKQDASETEHYVSMGAVAEAEVAAKTGDGPRVLQSLKKAGKWGLKKAEDIGINLAAELIKRSIGLQDT